MIFFAGAWSRVLKVRSVHLDSSFLSGPVACPSLAFILLYWEACSLWLPVSPEFEDIAVEDIVVDDIAVFELCPEDVCCGV